MARIKTDPIAAGFNPAGLERAEAILNEGMDKKLYPGGSVWIHRKGVDAMVCSAGFTDYSGKAKVDENTLFDMASVTKPLACASSILMLAQEGYFDIGIRPLVSYFPNRKLPHLEGITLHHLLTHTSGLPAWKDLYSKGQTREQTIEELFEIPLINKPGTVHVYSCMGYIMLSLVIEAVSGEKIDKFSVERIFKPLGMENTCFNPEKKTGRMIAATDNCPYRKKQLVGEVHDGNAYALNGVSGNAGLFSTANDVARFCHNVLIGRDSGGQFPLNPLVLKRIFANAIPENIGGQTYGWFTWPNDMVSSGDFVSRFAIGHTGFTGTAVIIDPSYDMYAILLTNRVCNNDDGLSFRHLRRRFFNAVFGSIL